MPGPSSWPGLYHSTGNCVCTTDTCSHIAEGQKQIVGFSLDPLVKRRSVWMHHPSPGLPECFQLLGESICHKMNTVCGENSSCNGFN